MRHHACVRGLIIAALLGGFLLAAASSWAGSIEWVKIGNPGNSADSTGYGAVIQRYQISKYEITNAQYIGFLTAVASVGDANSLYDSHMATSMYGGIQRTGSGASADPYVYSAKDGDVNWLSRPVNWVDWYDTLRFANWLQNGQRTGTQDANTTEDGAYDMSLGSDVVRKAGATYFLPTVDEWYKAAYYDPDKPGEAGYWDYPMQNDVPNRPDNSDPSSDTGNSANFTNDDRAVGSPYFTTPAGAYALSDSPYGTFDQGGNVAEWTESALGDGKEVRGGAWTSHRPYLSAGKTGARLASHESESIGFRIARLVPEPGAAVLLGIGGAVLGLVASRKRRRS